ncbi:MAG: hypothetical protein ABJA02_01510 [Acidobacteriota bacterium]
MAGTDACAPTWNYGGQGCLCSDFAGRDFRALSVHILVFGLAWNLSLGASEKCRNDLYQIARFPVPKWAKWCHRGRYFEVFGAVVAGLWDGRSR